MSAVRLRVSSDELSRGAVLEGERYHYIVRVRRLQVGDTLELFDGSGLHCDATLVALEADSARVEPRGEARPGPANRLAITSIVSLIKGDRMDWAIAKLTELGVSRIVPVQTERTVVSLAGERAVSRVERYHRLAREAARQCGRADVPDIGAVTPLEAAVRGCDEGLKWVLTGDGAPLRESLPLEPPASVAILTGPEGGLSPAELKTATETGFVRLALGPRVLRAETAAIAAATAVGVVLGDLRG